MANLLSPDYMVVVPDRPGYGLTGGRAGGFAANAAAVARLLRSLSVASVVVVGHSWGGGVALQMAVDLPQVIRGMVLVSSVSPGDEVGRLDRLLARPLVGTALVAVTLSTAGSFLAWGPGLALAGRKLNGRPPQHISEVARSWRRPATWSSFAIEQRALVHELPRLAGRLGSVTAPTAVLVGTADRVIAPESGRRLAAAVPGATLVEVAGAGHLLPQLRPDAVARAVRQVAGATGA